MNSFKTLLPNIHRCAAEHMSKLALTMIVMGLISYAALGAASVPLRAALASGAVNPAVFAAAFLPAFTVTVLNNILLYGFFVMTHLLYKKERAVLGHLFTGFRDFARAFKASLFFVTVYITVSFAAGVALYFAGTSFFNEHFEWLFIAMIGISFFILAFLYIRFAFVWFFLYENPSLNVISALRKSAVLMKKKRIDFFLLCIQSGSPYLFFVPFSLILPPILGTKLLALSAILRILSTICLYIGLIRIAIAFAAAYEEVRGQNKGRPETGAIEACAEPSASQAETERDGENRNSGDTGL